MAKQLALKAARAAPIAVLFQVLSCRLGVMTDSRCQSLAAWNFLVQPVGDFALTVKVFDFLKKEDLMDITSTIEKVQPYLSSAQLQVMRDNTHGEEGEFFIAKLVSLAAQTDATPVTYQQDGLGDLAVVHLHYFLYGHDWYITEKDMDGGVSQAFGLAKLDGHDPELGYISISEITSLGAELDLYWELKTISEIKSELVTA